jgi:beta-galactosidase GanA
VAGVAGRGTARIWAEALRPVSRTTRVLLRYGSGNAWLTGEPAALEHRYGQGAIVYLGALVDPALMRTFVGRILGAAHVSSPFGVLPSGVELMRRVGADREIVIVINHGPMPRTIHLPYALQDVLHRGRTVRTLRLASQGIAVLERRSAS